MSRRSEDTDISAFIGVYRRLIAFSRITRRAVPVSQGIGVPTRRINEIVQGERAITADTALRFGKFFGMEAQFWMNLQSHYELEAAKDAMAGKLAREVEVLKAA